MTTRSVTHPIMADLFARFQGVGIDGFEDGWNGTSGYVQLDHTTSYVKPANRIVMSPAGGMNLPNTLAYQMWEGSGNKNQAANAQSFEAAMPRIVATIATHELITGITHSRPVDPEDGYGSDFTVDIDGDEDLERAMQHPIVSYRSGDTISDAAFTEMLAEDNGDALQSYVTVAKKFLLYMSENVDEFASLVHVGEFIAITAIYNGLHRHATEGHSCYTDDLRKIGTTSNSLSRVFGAKQSEGLVFLEKWGHDVLHFLTDESLEMICNVMTGHAVQNHLIKSGTRFSGQISNGTLSVKDAICLTQSALDRWPPGNVGLGAIMVGLDVLAAMLSAMALKATAEEGSIGNVAISIEAIKDFLSSSRRNRDDIMEAKDALRSPICMAFGFIKTDKALRHMLEDHGSLEKFASNNAADVSVGASLGEFFKDKEHDASSVSTAINAMFTSLAMYADTIGVRMNAVRIAPFPTKEETEDHVLQRAVDRARMERMARTGDRE